MKQHAPLAIVRRRQSVVARRYRAWRIKVAKRRIAAAIALLDELLVESDVSRKERRRIWRELVSKTRTFGDLADLGEVYDKADTR